MVPYYASGDPGLFKSLKRLKLKKITKPLRKLTLGKVIGGVAQVASFFPGIGPIAGSVTDTMNLGGGGGCR